MSGRDPLDLELQAYIEQGTGHDDDATCDDARFNELALELFAYQYENNAPYRRFCRSRRTEPGRLTRWEQIPPVPLTAFKELTLACEPPETAAAVFMTSGSTDPARRGRNHHPHLHLYDASLRAGSPTPSFPTSPTSACWFSIRSLNSNRIPRWRISSAGSSTSSERTTASMRWLETSWRSAGSPLSFAGLRRPVSRLPFSVHRLPTSISWMS